MPALLGIGFLQPGALGGPSASPVASLSFSGGSRFTPQLPGRERELQDAGVSLSSSVFPLRLCFSVSPIRPSQNITREKKNGLEKAVRFGF